MMALWGKKASKKRDAVDLARADFDGQFPVAFLGMRQAGKTVHYALLKDVAARRLKRHTNGKYLGIATVGARHTNRIIDGLYNGRFPEKTAEEEAMWLVVEVASTENGTDVSLIHHDMAGEEYDRILVAEMPIEERIRQMLEASKTEGEPYGPMAHLIFAKIYVVLVDCSLPEPWGGSQAYIRDAIKSIHAVKNYIHALYNDKVTSHLAIVFTKCDTLGDERGVDALAGELDVVDAAVARYIGGNVKHFKSRVDSTRTGDEEASKIDENKREARPDDAERPADHGQAPGRAHGRAAAEEYAPAAAASPGAARPAGDSEPAGPRQAAHGGAGRERADLENEAGDMRAEMGGPRPGGARARGAPARYRPDKPLSYNADDYLDMIDWMIRMARREAGY